MQATELIRVSNQTTASDFGGGGGNFWNIVSRLQAAQETLSHTHPLPQQPKADAQPVALEATSKLQVVPPEALILGLYLHWGTVRGCPCAL